MPPPRFAIAPAESAQEIAAAKALVRDYAANLDFDLDYQGFAAELAGFPGKYAPPDGALLVGRLGGRILGVVALQDLGGGFAEMKRLYVRPEARGSGLGRALVEAIVAEGRRLGFRAMRLDSVPGQHDRAITLYRQLGFRQIPPYYASPIPGTLFFQLDYA